MTSVLVVAPTPVMRAGLRSLLSVAGFEVLAENPTLPTAPSEAAVIVLGEASLLRDWEGPPAGSDTGLVVLTDDERLLSRLQGWPLKGWAILPPDASLEELKPAIEAVAQGLVVLPRALAGSLAEPAAPEPATLTATIEEPLTGRELEVLELLSQGLPNKTIARRLQISEHTVKFHVSSLYAKLDASSRAEAVSRGARLGLITF